MSRVEIKGFKTIAKKTVLTFPGAITCIAGPNGCGKSNVIDAIRWALGEQSARALRAGAMGDVIFSGTQDVPGSGMAGVTLEFTRVGRAFPKELDGFNEFSIARRLFRSGESIYTINDVKCRLKDITDLFLDTGLDRQGYAIIEQGKIKDIIQAKPEDIRHILEEVAAVGRFRVKRTEAIKRLEASQGNLDRIKDLLSEVGKQRDSLKTQAGKARRYQVLKDKINGLTRLVWTLEINTIKGRKSSLDEDVATIEKGIQGVQEGYIEQTERLAAINTQVMDVKEAMEAVTAALRAARARLEVAKGEKEAGELRLADIRSTIAMLGERMQKAQEENVGALGEIETCTAELEHLGREVGAVQEEYGRRKADVDASQAAFTAAAGSYDQKRAVLFEQIGHARAAQQRIGFLSQRQEEVAANIAKRRQELTEMAAEEAQLAAELAALDADAQACEEALRVKQDELGRLTAARAEAQAAFEKDSQRLIAQEKRHTELVTKIAMLDRIINRTQSTGQGSEGNGFKRVSDALAVHPGYEGAAGSFGDVLDYLIINDHADVIGPEGVRAKGPGFVPTQPHLNGGEREDAAPQGEGLLGPLHAYVDAGKGYEAVREALTRGKWVVENMPCAVRIWREGHRAHTYVTRDGMILESSGIVRTSPDKEKYTEILKAKAERAALAEQKQALESELSGIKAALNDAKGRIGELTRALEGVTTAIRVSEREREGLKVKRQGIVSRRERMAERKKTFDQDILAWEETARGMEQESLKALEEMQAMDALVEGLQEELKGLEEKKAEAKRTVDLQQAGLEQVGTRLNGMKVASASREERLKGLKELLGRRYQEIENDKARIEELNAKVGEVKAGLEATETALGQAQQEIAELEARHEAYQPEYQAGLDQAQAMRTRIDELGGARAALEKQKQELLLGDKEQEIALKMLMERYTARFGDELPEVPEGFDPDQAREECAAYQTRIDGMGQINFASIESYEEAQARFDDLHRQYEDLVLACTRLRELIANIERESTKEFMATFVKVRAHFQEIFTLMFGGGQADIVLQEGGLDAGVDIFACPPFKRLKAMSLLSEGEKTLTAISFIFALFKVKPSPFCILDEVDAPLDDANVERFNRLIKTFARDSQFLVVTHNKNTMEIADIIYGVTFDVPGVTKVVSMDLQATGT